MGERVKKSSKQGGASAREQKIKKPAMLVVLSSPSGGGKTTICARLRRKIPEFVYSVSVTTRSPRQGEKDGVHYKFVTQAKFQQLIAADRLAEYATVHGHLYGTPRKNIKDAITRKQVILFDMDVVGGLALKREYQEAVLIFLVPPSWEVMRKRLMERGTESPAVLRRRLERARRELPFWRSYDYVVTNGRLADSVADCVAVIRAERLRSVRAPRFRSRWTMSIDKLEE